VKQPRHIRLDFFEVKEYYDFLLANVRRQVRDALNWKRNFSHLDRDGYADYLKWAKQDAEKARHLARRLKIHFGKESWSVVLAKKAAFAAYLEQRRAA
jgi:hypothetical protein